MSKRKEPDILIYELSYIDDSGAENVPIKVHFSLEGRLFGLLTHSQYRLTSSGCHPDTHIYVRKKKAFLQ